MRLKARFSLIGLGIVLFLIITPALVLYARGFKIDWQNRKITKTGALVIKTRPSDADIFLDNVKQAGSTPDNIRFLLPGDYEVRIEKDGYQPWTKRLNIRAQYVTKVNLDRDFITLFVNKPQIAQSWSASSTGISKSGDEIIFVNGGRIGVINVNKGGETDLGTTSGIKIPALPAISVSWQNSGAIFQALKDRSDWGLTDKQLPQVSRIETDGKHIAAKLGPDLYALDNKTPLLLEKNVTAFTLDGENVWYLAGSFLKRFNFSANNTETVTSTAPIAATGQIIRADNQIYAILNSNLFILNDSFEKIYDNVTNAYWNADAKLLTFGNNNEILTFDPADKKTELVLRSSSSIKNPVLDWADGYIFFENGQQVKAVELDGRGHRNVYSLASLPDDRSSFTVSADGRTLYVFNAAEIKKYIIQ